MQKQSKFDGNKFFVPGGTTLVYGETAYLSCNRRFKYESNFKGYCERSFRDIHEKPYKFTGYVSATGDPAAYSEKSMLDYEIFSQFWNDFNYVSKLGNPSLAHELDWSKVIKLEDSGLDVMYGKWDKESKTCRLMVGYNIKIIT
jgi:hypothetical protein